MLEYQAAACEKKKTEEEAAKIYTELLEMEQEDGNREMLYKKLHNYMKQQAGAIWQWISVFRESEN